MNTNNDNKPRIIPEVHINSKLAGLFTKTTITAVNQLRLCTLIPVCDMIKCI